MGFGVGSLSRLVYAKEVTWGTVIADAVHHRVLPFRSESLVGGQGSVESDEISGNRMYEEPLQGNLNVNGDINVQWSADAHAFLLWAMLAGITNPVLQTVRHNGAFDPKVLHGAGNERYLLPAGGVTDDHTLAEYVGAAPEAIAGGGDTYAATDAADRVADIWTHFIEQSKATSVDLPSFAIEKGFLNVGDTGYFLPFRGVTVSRLTFEVAPEAFVIGAIGLVGKEEATPVVGPSGILPADVISIPHRGLNSFDGAINVNGAAAANIVRVTMNLDNQVTQENVVGSQLAGARYPGRVRVAGTMEALFDSGTLYSRYKAYTTTDMKLGLKDNAAMEEGTFGPESEVADNGAYYRDREIQMLLPGFKFSGATPQVGGEGPVNIPLEFTAFRDPTDDRQVQFIVTNGQADLTVNDA